MQTFHLQFPNTEICALAGHMHGKSVFDAQVRDHIDRTQGPFCFVFPDHITMVTSSFIAGFFYDFYCHDNFAIRRDDIIIESKHDLVVRKIMLEL